MKDLAKELQPFTGNLPDAIQSGFPSLRRVSLERGETYASGLVAVTLLEAVTLLSFPVSDVMVKAAADLISQRFYDVNQADLTLFKKMVISGEIGGKLYRMDARTLIELFEEYYDKRCYEAEQLIQRRQDEWRRIDTLPTAEKVQEAYAKLKKEKPEPKKQIRVDVEAIKGGMAWLECEHDFVYTELGVECSKCKSIIPAQ